MRCCLRRKGAHALCGDPKSSSSSSAVRGLKTLPNEKSLNEPPRSVGRTRSRLPDAWEPQSNVFGEVKVLFKCVIHCERPTWHSPHLYSVASFFVARVLTCQQTCPRRGMARAFAWTPGASVLATPRTLRHSLPSSPQEILLLLQFATLSTARVSPTVYSSQNAALCSVSDDKAFS